MNEAGEVLQSGSLPIQMAAVTSQPARTRVVHTATNRRTLIALPSAES
jgi:hypothetical protein